MFYIQIKGGIVVNRSVTDEPLSPEWIEAAGGDWVQNNDDVQIGWSHDGKAFSPPPRGHDPEPMPDPVDPRDVKIAALEAAVSALKKSGVLTDAMIEDGRA